jgi:hypothetical protein
MFIYFGVLIAYGLHHKDNTLEFDLPSIVWKRIVNEEASLDDIREIDTYFIQCLTEIRDVTCSAELFEEYTEQTFTTFLSDGTEFELKPDGKN